MLVTRQRVETTLVFSQLLSEQLDFFLLPKSVFDFCFRASLMEHTLISVEGWVFLHAGGISSRSPSLQIS